MQKKTTLLSVVCVSLLTALCLTACAFFDADDALPESVSRLFSDLTEETENPYIGIERENFTPSPYYTPLETETSFGLLGKDSQRELYRRLIESAYLISSDTVKEGHYRCEQVVLDGVTLSEAEIRTVIKAIYDDHPELFWVTSSFGHLTSAERNYTAVQLYSDFSSEEVRKMRESLNETVNSYLFNLPEGLSAYELEKLAHDYLIDRCEYHTEVAQAQTLTGFETAYTVYGAMVERRAVCEGYARSFQLLMNLSGVRCVGITGLGTDASGESELHMWNAVMLQGDWYLVDVTWDDQEDTFQRHDYFNLNEAIMNRDHEPSALSATLSEDQINGDETYSAVAMNLFIPECKVMAYNYIIRECPHLTDDDGYAVRQALYKAALDQERYFQFYIDPEVYDFDEAIGELFSYSPQYFFEYVDEVNNDLEEYMIDTTAISYVYDAALSYVVTELNYL